MANSIKWLAGATAALITMNASALTLNTINFSVKQSTAHGSLAWNGDVAEYFNLATAGNYRITVRAAGMLAGGVGPDMALRVNEVTRQTVRLNHTDYRTYTFDIAFQDGVQKIGFSYCNDATISGQDRNLLLDTVTVSPLVGGSEPVVSTVAAWNTWAQTRDADVLASTNAQIAENRMAPAQVMVVNEHGFGVQGATVEVNQTDHEFLFGANMFGYDAYTGSQNTTYKQKFADVFNYATVPFYWSWMESTQGQPNYPAVDAMVNWANANGIAMKGHAVLYGDPTMIPAWAGTPTEAMQLQRITNIFNRYGASIKNWDLVNEPVSIPGAMSVTKAYQHARSLQPEGNLIVNEYGQFYTGWDIFYGNSYQTLRDYIPAAKAAGMPIDTVGLQAHEPLDTAWPLETVWNTLNLYAALGTDVHITEFSPTSNGNAVLGTPYRGTWTEATQAKFAEDFYRVCFAHPGVSALSWWDVSDIGSWLPKGGLLRTDLSSKPAYDTLKNLINNEWHTAANGASDAQGRFLVNGFHGKYAVKVTYNGQTYNATMTISEDGANVATVTMPGAGGGGVVPADTTAPVITLGGTSTVTLNVGTAYTDAGATASDNKDGNITSNIVTTGTVNNLAVGTYTIAYNVSDAAGNVANQVTRTVNVVDTLKPVITLTGASSISIKKGSTFTDPGATASDNADGNITARITKSGTVKTGTIGTYYVTYNVKDLSNNAATAVKRTVKVVR